MATIDVGKFVAHDGGQFVFGLALLEKFAVDVHVLATGGEGVERFAVDEVELHLAGEHPGAVFFAMGVGAVVLTVHVMGGGDDAIADGLDVGVELGVVHHSRLQAGVGAVSLGDDGSVGGAAAGQGRDQKQNRNGDASESVVHAHSGSA